MKKISAIIISVVVLILHSKTLSAVTVTSTQSGNWSATATWGGNPAPVAGDIVIIQGGFTVTVDIPNAACLNIQLGGSLTNSGDGTLGFSSGSHLTVTGLVTIGNGNRKGSISMATGGILTCEGLVLNGLGTWTPGTGTVELTVTNTLPNNGITSFNNLTISGGTTLLNANTSVTGNLVINSTAILDGGPTPQLTVGGNWTNNGTFTGNLGTVIFNKNGNQTISGTGLNNFNLVRVNMGVSSTNTLEVTASSFNAPDGFLTLSNGTLKMSGTFTFANTFITAAPTYNIPPSAGLWINNPNVTVTAQAGGLSVRGILRISAGTYNIGTLADQNLDYVAGASVIIEGGALNIAGHFGRNNSASTITYSQSGGTVTVVKQGSTDLVFGGFDIGATGSSFTMSGGIIVVSNSTSAPADYLNLSSLATVTGGTLQIGDVNTLNAQTIRIQSSAPVGNLLVFGATAQTTKPTALLLTSSINITGSITLQTGTSFNANGLNITLGGDWSDDGTFTAGPLVTFNGSGAQSVSSPSTEIFNSLTINKTGSLTVNSSVTVNNSFSLLQGTVALGPFTLTLNGNSVISGTFSSANTGTVNFNQGSAGQNIFSANFGNLIFSNFDKTLASSGTIGISGTFTPGTATGHVTTGSTLDFNGTNQILPVFPYNNLTLSGSGTKTGSGIMTISGKLTINPGILFPGTNTLNLNGTSHINNGTIITATLSVPTGAILSNNGTVTISSSLTGTGAFNQTATGILNLGGTVSIGTLNTSVTGNTVTYNGTGTQTLTGTSFSNLVINNSSGVTLTGDVNIAGSLSITSGALLTGIQTVILGPAAILSEAGGQTVVGNITSTQNVTATTGTISFGNIGADITLNGTAPGVTTVLRKTGVASAGNSHNSVKRYFDITPAINTGLNAGLVFHYDASELNGQNPAILELYQSKDAGTTWNNQGGAINTISRTVTIAGINDFSRWTLSDTVNNIGGTLTPATVSISPASKVAGDPTFNLTINGTQFINGKSVVRFNGSNRTTVYINSRQLTASIPASDLLVAGTFPVAVFNTGGGGLSNQQTLTITAPVGINDVEAGVALKLFQNYPNPFNQTTNISWHLSENNNINLKIYDSTGKEIEELINGFQVTGDYSIDFTVNPSLPSGIYYCRLQAGSEVRIMKMLLLR